MSWLNPSPEEAAESYSFYKKKYAAAANQKAATKKEAESYYSERQAAIRQKGSLSTQKASLEKRLEGVKAIVKMLEGAGGWFSVNVPNDIDRANAQLSQTEASYRKSIRLSGVNAASLENAFSIKTVEGDPRSNFALAEYKAEIARLEQEIEELKTKIGQLSTIISTLKTKIMASASTISGLQSAMNSYAFEMNHFKKYMY